MTTVRLAGKVGPVAPEVVRLEHLSRRFPGPVAVPALVNVSLTLARGAFAAVVGPSGSGKSTLLHVLGLLDRPSSGSYILDGVDMTDLDDNSRSVERGRRIGFVFQNFHLLSGRSVEENVALAHAYAARPRRERGSSVAEALASVGLSHRAAWRPEQLSGGEQQRAALARALVVQPSLLLCDEPTGNLDTANRDRVIELLRKVNAEHQASVIIVTHDEEVARHCDRRVQLLDGCVVNPSSNGGRW